MEHLGKANYIRTRQVSHYHFRRTIIVAAPLATLPFRIKAGIEREFPASAVAEFDSVSTALSSGQGYVALILVHSDLLRATTDAAAQMSRFHGGAPVAALYSGRLTDPAGLELVSSKLIRGVLPLDMRHEVLMSAIALLLRGGEYFPRILDSEKTRPMRNFRETAGHPTTRQGSERARVEQLTKRELQVIELVSSGLQNKLVAAKLHVSEHTVKIHLHNIITKLGAHNRTEASAIFRQVPFLAAQTPTERSL